MIFISSITNSITGITFQLKFLILQSDGGYGKEIAAGTGFSCLEEFVHFPSEFFDMCKRPGEFDAFGGVQV